jgi:hypothetical protein
VGSFICIGPGIEEGEPSSCGGAPRGVVLGGHKILSPPCVLRSQNLPLVERPFLREKRLRNAHDRGLCGANASLAPREIVCSGHGSGFTPLAQALLPWLERYSRKKMS